MALVLTGDQQQAVESILDWAKSGASKQWFVLAGYAGTGKTTTAAEVSKRLQREGIRIAVATPTGKAAHVLSVKGVPATTIHRFCYQLVGEDEDGGPLFEFAGVRNPQDLILIVDEASMVQENMHADLVSTGVRILYIGDPGQLPPIQDDPYLLDDPDVLLTRIMRQVEGNPIIRFAHAVRAGEDPSNIPRICDDRLIVAPFREFDFDSIDADIYLCGKNVTRVAMNKVLRRDREDENVERVVVLRNDYALNLMNGMTGDLEVGKRDDEDRPLHGLFVSDNGIRVSVRLVPDNFGQASYRFLNESQRNGRVYMDYGYCLTVHKAQGSEWDSVVVLDQPFGDEETKRRWRYTAATRAKKRLVWLQRPS